VDHHDYEGRRKLTSDEMLDSMTVYDDGAAKCVYLQPVVWRKRVNAIGEEIDRACGHCVGQLTMKERKILH
jgi:hypothetical protein